VPRTPCPRSWRFLHRGQVFATSKRRRDVGLRVSISIVRPRQVLSSASHLRFFLPYDAPTPKSSDEFRWDLLPDVWVEVAVARLNYLNETCQRHQQLVQVLYYDRSDTDTRRVVPSPFFFDGPVQPEGFTYKSGLLG
jgi:hypothetical protein